jgi:hypothetical protein
MEFHITSYRLEAAALQKPGSEECSNNLAIIRNTCSITGTPIEEDKVEGPATTLPFLGIELDTTQLEIRLPADKLQRLQEETREWRREKGGIKWDLLSLIGTLSMHARQSVRAGPSYTSLLTYQNKSDISTTMSGSLLLHVQILSGGINLLPTGMGSPCSWNRKK